MGDGVRVRLAVETTVTTTMERRKFVIGAGALATGSAAALGTGAFNVARVDRGINVEMVDDSDAYLGLEETDGEYTDVDDGVLSVEFGENTTGGEGLGENSNYVFTDVFKIVNQGTDDIAVTMSDSLDAISWDTEFPRAYYSFDKIGTTNDVNGDGDFTGGTAADDAVLAPGDDLYVHFEFVGRDEETGGDPDDLPEALGVYAEATDPE